MDIRDILLSAFIFGLLPFILKRPQVGIYAWSWLSYMNPHRMTWGFAYSFPFAQIVAITALISIALWKEPKRIPIFSVTIIWLMFIVWMCITTIFAMYPEWAWLKLQTVLKIQLVTFLTILVIRNKKDLDALIWVICLSIGFFAFKGGVFTIVTLGAFRVWGPPESFIADNNALAVASFMITPLMLYLRSQAKSKWVKRGVTVAIILFIVSAFGSQSRGALIAAVATSAFLWLKTSNKLISGAAILVVAVGILSFMPQSWYDRMNTISNYEQDGSAMGRIAAWKMSMNLAGSRLTGGGFEMWGPPVYRLYSSNPDDWDRNVAAHSIYFTAVGEHGWPGLILFLMTMFASWRLASRLIRQTSGRADLRWMYQLCKLIQVSLVAYASGGAFLNLLYFDLPWHLLAILVCLRTIYLNEKDKEAEPA